jgi:dolichol-phosphate mannosyltransferase
MSSPQSIPAFAQISAFPECPRGKFVVPEMPHPVRKLSLIVPTYQEAGNIQDFLLETCAVLDRELPSQYAVIVVDDDSPDRTWMRVTQLMPTLPALHLVRRSGERGLAGAVMRGYQVATGEFLGTINADFQHPPQVLKEMIRLSNEADVVVASRFCEGGGTGDWPQDRLMMSRIATQAAKFMLPEVFHKLADPLSGCYMFRRAVVEGIEFNPTGFKTLIEILARGHASRIVECPYEMRARRSGSSKATIDASLAFLRQLQQLRIQNAS